MIKTYSLVNSLLTSIVITCTAIAILFSSNIVIAEKRVTNKSNIELEIKNQVQLNLAESLNTLETIVNINSGTMNFEGVKAVAEHLMSELNTVGFKTQWKDGHSFNRAGHLIASYGDSKNNLNILLIGHLDTVFSINDNFKKFEIIDQEHIAGPGITDMKGGDVIIVAAVKALKNLGLLDAVNIKIVMTGDEESSGRPLSKSKKAIIDAAKWADVALGFEDGDGDIKTAVTSRRGASGWKLTVSGQAAHSSQIFRDDLGYGAIYEASRILNQFRQTLSNIPYLTFNPGLIAGGTEISHDKKLSQATVFGKNNVIAKDVIVTGDIRALSPAQLSEAQAAMLKIAAENLAHTKSVLTFSEGYPPMAPSAGNKKLLELYSQISIDHGYGKVNAVNPSRAGAADISFAANHVTMALDGLGLMGTGGHTKDEIANISSFKINTEKAAILIYRLSQTNLHQQID
jgi:glutamate carboxypeptidase